MSTHGASGIGLKRLQHLVLWVSDVEQSVRFYRDILGFEVKTRHPNAAFMRIPGSPDDPHLGLFEQRGATGPDERAVRMYHSAWEVGELTDQQMIDMMVDIFRRHPGGQVMYLQGSKWPSLNVVERLEQRIGVPVVQAVAARC